VPTSNPEIELKLSVPNRALKRLGAYVCGEPAWDPDFNTADLAILAPLARLNPRYARRFLGT